MDGFFLCFFFSTRPFLQLVSLLLSLLTLPVRYFLPPLSLSCSFSKEKYLLGAVEGGRNPDSAWQECLDCRERRKETVMKSEFDMNVTKREKLLPALVTCAQGRWIKELTPTHMVHGLCVIDGVNSLFLALSEPTPGVAAANGSVIRGLLLSRVSSLLLNRKQKNNPTLIYCTSMSFSPCNTIGNSRVKTQQWCFVKLPFISGFLIFIPSVWCW